MNITQKDCDNIVNFAVENGYEVEMFEGALNDSYIIHTENKFKISGKKTSKYIAIVSVYLNEWSSALELKLINCEKRISNIRKNWS